MTKNQIVILFKTHIWNDEIEEFVNKIMDDCQKNEIGHPEIGVDLYVLLHDEKAEQINNIKSEKIKNQTLTFLEKDISSLYQKGFITMWDSNHWIMMWFYHWIKTPYKYYWSIEYDVRITGNTLNIWKYVSDYDFLYTLGNFTDANNIHHTFYTGTKLLPTEKYHGYLQIARYSDKTMQYLDQCFSQGENGQDEMITFSLIRRQGLTMSNKFLQSLIKGRWTWLKLYSTQNKIIYEKLKLTNQTYILHPIK